MTQSRMSWTSQRRCTSKDSRPHVAGFSLSMFHLRSNLTAKRFKIYIYIFVNWVLNLVFDLHMMIVFHVTSVQ